MMERSTIYVANATATLVPLWFPISIRFVRAHLQTSFSWRMSLQLRGEPLEPFKGFT